MDWDSAEGKKLAARLRKELVIWITTVSKNGMPVPTPVWFLWENDSFLIYTQPKSLKLRNLAANSKATLNLNSDQWGGDVAVFSGEISIEKDGPPAAQRSAYLQKYQEGIKDLQMTPEGFLQDYSVPLRFHIQKVRAW